MFTTLLEVAGLALIVVACFTFAAPIGLLAGGAALFITGMALEGRERA